MNFETRFPGSVVPKRGFRLWPVLLFIIFGAVYYFANQELVPISGRKHLVTISREQEMALGLDSYRSVLQQASVIEGGEAAEQVKEVGRRIAKIADAPDFKWDFNLLDSDQVNAFCLPGGKVAVYSGIMPVTKNVDGLAVVMGHEIAHAIARHGAERMAQEQLTQFGALALGVASSEMDQQQRSAVMQAFGIGTRLGVLLPFSRTHESEADYIGLILMARACFDPNEAPRFWQRMSAVKSGQAPPEFLSTHPNDGRRVEQLKEWLPEALAERAKNCSNSN